MPRSLCLTNIYQWIHSKLLGDHILLLKHSYWSHFTGNCVIAPWEYIVQTVISIFIDNINRSVRSPWVSLCLFQVFEVFSCVHFQRLPSVFTQGMLQLKWHMVCSFIFLSISKMNPLELFVLKNESTCKTKTFYELAGWVSWSTQFFSISPKKVVKCVSLVVWSCMNEPSSLDCCRDVPLGASWPSCQTTHWWSQR